MPVSRSSIESNGADRTAAQYRTLLGLFFDNPDSFYTESEIRSLVERPEELLAVQLWLVRLAGVTEQFPVRASEVNGNTVYGLASSEARSLGTEDVARFNSDTILSNLSSLAAQRGR